MGPSELQKPPGHSSRAMLQCLGNAPWDVHCPPLQSPKPGVLEALMCLVKCRRTLTASGQALVGIPRAQSVAGSRLLLSQGNGTLQKCLHSLVLGSWQTQNEREVRARVPLQGQQPMPMCCSPQLVPL